MAARNASLSGNAAETSRCVHLLFREPRCVLNCLLDILASDVRIAYKNIIECRTMGDLTDNYRYRDAHTTNTDATTHHVWVKGNSFEHGLSSNERETLDSGSALRFARNDNHNDMAL